MFYLEGTTYVLVCQGLSNIFSVLHTFHTLFHITFHRLLVFFSGGKALVFFKFV